MSDDFFVMGGDGPVPQADKIGAKGHNLARVAVLGLPVPPAFVIGTRYCGVSIECSALVEDVARELPRLMETVEGRMHLRFGDAHRPLLVSVRSGAPASMPGMMQTLLNVGLTEGTLPGFLRTTGNPRLAFDAYRRLIAQYGETVDGIAPEVFEEARVSVVGHGSEQMLDFAQLRLVAQRFLAAYREAAGSPFPQDAREQLYGAIQAVFRSWRSPHAIAYRASHGIAEEPGTAVIVQAMVFGNAGGRSGSGVAFTRDPVTGAPGLWVDYLVNAQGEDVVSGRRVARGAAHLERALPALWEELRSTVRTLEAEFRDMQDIEFTIEDGRLYVLQTRAGKRSDIAALRIMLDLHGEGLIDREELARRATARNVWRITTTHLASAEGEVARSIASGASASAGVAVGEIVLDEARARERAAAGAKLVLVRRDAETADLAALELAQGIVTARGARTSHAAVVARSLGKVCVVGCEQLVVDPERRSVTVGACMLPEGAEISVDGNTGNVYAGRVRTVEARPVELLERLADTLGTVEASPG